MTGVHFFSFPITKAVWICSEHIDNFRLFMQTNLKPQQPAQAVFTSLHWHGGDLANKDVSSRMGQSKTKERGQHLSCYPSKILSHEVTSIQRRMAGVMLQLKWGDNGIHRCWAYGAAPTCVQLLPLITGVNQMRLLQQTPPYTAPQKILQTIDGHRNLALKSGSPYMTVWNISKLAEQGCSSSQGLSVWTLPV